MCVCQNWFMSSLNFKNKITWVLITLDNVNKASKTKKNDIPLFQAFAAQNIYKEWWIHPSLKDLHYRHLCRQNMFILWQKGWSFLSKNTSDQIKPFFNSNQGTSSSNPMKDFDYSFAGYLKIWSSFQVFLFSSEGLMVLSR